MWHGHGYGQVHVVFRTPLASGQPLSVSGGQAMR